jgi:NADH:ubiquinone oxidoreductase subunit 2 (subunit N)
MEHILTLMTYIPIAGMAVVLCLPSTAHNLIRWTAAIATVPPLLLAIWLFVNFDRSQAGFQFMEHYKWIPSFNIEYFVGVDGISITMVLLTALLSFICMFASWGIEKAVKGYFALFLLLDAAMMGVFVALDFFLFYIFWELMLLPMYFLIGIWGGPRREYAAIKFFLYTLAGSVLMLLALLALYFSQTPHTFDMTKLMAAHASYPHQFQIILWIALFIGFAIKIPAFPFHTWLPDAHVEAPTAISVILAGILLKMGTYGILRINFGMLPAATAELSYYFLGALGAFNIVYGALCAMAQTDFKKLVAYSSISHMGYVMLGMASFTPMGIQGRAADVQPRHGHRHAVPPRRRDLRPRASPRDRRLRRPGVDHAHVHRCGGARVLRRVGPARAVGIHLRGTSSARRLAKVSGVDGNWGQRGDSDRRLRAVDDAACLPRQSQREIHRAPGHQRTRAVHPGAARGDRGDPRFLPAAGSRPDEPVAEQPQSIRPRRVTAGGS